MKQLFPIRSVEPEPASAQIFMKTNIHGKPDFISKLQIALKEANETGYWLELLLKTNDIAPAQYQELDNACSQLRVMQYGKEFKRMKTFFDLFHLSLLFMTGYSGY